MQEQMQAELIYFGLSVLMGVLAAMVAAGLDRLHRRYRRGIWLGLLDLGYWVLAGTALFLLCYARNSGILRAYALAGTLAGMVGWRCGFPSKRRERSKKEVAHSDKTS